MGISKKLLTLLIIFLILTSEVKAQIVINEVIPDPSEDENTQEWVELFNTSTQSLDLTGYKLVDAANHELIIDSTNTNNSATILANNFLVVNRNSSVFSLNNTGEEIISLYDTIGTTAIDIFAYTNSDTDRSWGRIPESGPVYSETLNPSPGSANQAPPTETPKPTPTPEPTSTPKPTSTLIPTKTPINTPTPKSPTKAALAEKPTNRITEAKTLQEENKREEVLALQEEFKEITSPTTKPEQDKEGSSKKLPAVAIILIIGGMLLIVAGIFPFLKRSDFFRSLLKKKEKDYNFFNEKED